MPLKESAAQTAGPYVHIGLTPNFCNISGVYASDLGSTMVNENTKDELIIVQGNVFDGSGAIVKDALIEIWQADAQGVYGSEHFSGWGRCATDMESGLFSFKTIKPGPIPHPSGSTQAPHITFWIVARGINLGLNTRLYFAEDAALHRDDPILQQMEQRDRLPTIIIPKRGGVYHFDIRLQGEGETIFFDI
jgi:protocatechuate 3,4-dioxygenase, alpha subunit